MDASAVQSGGSIEEALPGIATYEDSDLIGMARKLGPEVRVRGLTGRFLL